jgi:hypothetical protein
METEATAPDAKTEEELLADEDDSMSTASVETVIAAPVTIPTQSVPAPVTVAAVQQSSSSGQQPATPSSRPALLPTPTLPQIRPRLQAHRPRQFFQRPPLSHFRRPTLRTIQRHPIRRGQSYRLTDIFRVADHFGRLLPVCFRCHLIGHVAKHCTTNLY